MPGIPKVDGALEDKEPVPEADEQKTHSTPPAAETAAQPSADDAPTSPTLASHRISVTSMDDVSLEEGEFCPP